MKCSFCTKDQDDVKILIKSETDAAICEKCIAVCVEVMADKMLCPSALDEKVKE